MMSEENRERTVEGESDLALVVAVGDDLRRAGLPLGRGGGGEGEEREESQELREHLDHLLVGS